MTADASRTVLVAGAGLLGTSAGMALRTAGWRVLPSRPIRRVGSAGEGTWCRFERATVQRARCHSSCGTTVSRCRLPLPSNRSFRTQHLLTSRVRRVWSSIRCERQAWLPSLSEDIRWPGGSVRVHKARARTCSRGVPGCICPTPAVRGCPYRKVRELATATRAQVVEMTAAEHDEAVARVSHVPQLVASVLAAQLRDLDGAELELAGQGLARHGAHCRIGPRAVGRHHQDQPGRCTGEPAATSSHDLQALLADMDPTPVLMRGREGHARIPGKHGAPAMEYAVVPVVIPDEPGALARFLLPRVRPGSTSRMSPSSTRPGSRWAWLSCSSYQRTLSRWRRR